MFNWNKSPISSSFKFGRLGKNDSDAHCSLLFCFAEQFSTISLKLLSFHERVLFISNKLYNNIVFIYWGGRKEIELGWSTSGGH